MIIKETGNIIRYREVQSGRSRLLNNGNTFFKDFEIANINLNPKWYFLDVGCRLPAYTVKKLWELGYSNSYGFDIGAGLEIEWKNEKLKEGDVHNGIPFDLHFDVITISHVLEHCYNPILVKENILNHLKFGGYLHSIVPIDDDEGFFDHEPHRIKFANHEEHLMFYSDLTLIHQSYNHPNSVVIFKK